MKQKMYQIVFSLIFGLIMPSIVFGYIDRISVSYGETSGSDLKTTYETQQMNPTEKDDIQIPVLWDGSIVQQMELEEYLVGVLLGEMPANFHFEAKKAQAVAARTVTLRLMERGGKHEKAVVCTDPYCCQAFVLKEDYFASGGKEESYQQALDAVRATAGMVIYYGRELIDATYFSCSGGRTEDAVAVWGSEVAYLQAVDSPGEEDAKHYTDTLTLTPAQLEKKLGIDLQGPPSQWFTGYVYTGGDGVASVRIGGKIFTGKELRTLLGLKSTSFSVDVALSSVTFHTKGFGHRVGMSQYGANAMANSGCDFVEILTHYYTDIAVSCYLAE
jgi:stage II sporulation protein D